MGKRLRILAGPNGSGKSSSMSREEFFKRVENAEKTPSLRFENIDELDQYIRSL